jgi:predicted nucleotidyltransferase
MVVTPSSRLRIAEEFATWARDQLGPRLVRVVLFGSVARGDDREGSDIDVLLEVKGNPVPVRRLLGGRIMEIAASEGVFVSAFVQSAGAGSQPFGIYKVIEKEGRVLA